MSRIEFMSRLSVLLQNISAIERQEALQYYNDYFDDAGTENEMHVISELGSPEKVAATIKAGLQGQDEGSSEYSETGYTDTRFEKKESLAKHGSGTWQEEPQKESGILKILLIIGIILIGGPIIIPLACGIIATVLALFFAVAVLFIALFVAAVSIMIAGIIIFCFGITKMVLMLPAALLMAGLGMILFVLGMLGAIIMAKAAIVVLPGLFRGFVWLCRRPFERKAAV